MSPRRGWVILLSSLTESSARCVLSTDVDKLSWFSFLSGTPSLAKLMVGIKEVAEMLGMKPAVSWHRGPVSPVTGLPSPTTTPELPCDIRGCQVAGPPGKVWYPATHKHLPLVKEGHEASTTKAGNRPQSGSQSPPDPEGQRDWANWTVQEVMPGGSHWVWVEKATLQECKNAVCSQL